MITDSYSKMISDIGMRSMHGSSSDYDEELGLLLMQQQQQQQQGNDLENELSIYRSGSAPPTVEGSLSAVGGLFSCEGASLAEEELRSDPNYVSYYYSNVNRNPRLPPPLLSKEDWRFAQRSSVLGGIGDRRKANKDISLNSGENGIDARKEWSGNGLIGLPGLGLGSRQKSIAEIIQDDINHGTSVPKHPSRPVSRNAFDDNVESSASQYAHSHHDLASMNIYSGANIQNIGGVSSHSSAYARGASLSRSTTPDPQLLARAPSPHIPFVEGGKANSLDKRSVNGPNSFNSVSLGLNEPPDLVGALSAMTLSTNHVVDENSHLQSRVQHELDDDQKLLHLQNSYSSLSDSGKVHFNSIAQSARGSYLTMSRGSGVGMDLNNPSLAGDGKAEHHMPAVTTASAYFKGPSTSTLNGGGSSPSQYKNVDSPNSSFLDYGSSGYVVNPVSPCFIENQLSDGNLPPLFEKSATAMGVSGLDSRAMGGDLSLGPNLIAAAAEFQNLRRVGNHNAGNALEVPHMDPLYLQYLRSSGYGAAQVATLGDPAMDTASLGSSYMDLLGLQKAYLETLLSSQKSQYGLPSFGKSGSLNHGYYGNSGFGLGGSYSGSTLGGHLLGNSPAGLGGSMRHGELNIRFPSGMRDLSGGVMGWQSEACGSLNGNFGTSLLDEFKSNKTKCLELSEISGHVVEFSADQYGSRFIQQKLETATTEEKNMVFHEIMPQALSLMTDVFGNYVIQKFFEHGSASHIREFAYQLTGHVLTLSLQMYGCRVIQKAIEVVDLDQKTKMVAELDGHVMRCVRDQNGNHVIQKCIECIPENAIQFIVSTFYDQVVALSTHPYGCRVIQRVLEHCSGPKTQRIVMDEILHSVYILAQDQYGNYVVQHVLEHGKPHERSAIINKLIGQIVQMSLQKFASNVVEKCLTFGNPEERQALVNEMLGSTDENGPLQVMMKDQYANYVVQKVLETCDDQQLELILNRIKVHLNALKKYTYGKHIVARVEKLVAAGERRIFSLSLYTA